MPRSGRPAGSEGLPSRLPGVADRPPPGLVAGVDEAGRGCLAGPVVAAAVILPPGLALPGLRDSKALGPERRAEMAEAIRRAALGIGIGRAEVEEIDALNILRASLLAMGRALAALTPPPEHVVIDGLHAPPLAVSHQAVPHADALFPAVSAASIIAKVHRDALMVGYDRAIPGYGFSLHKGYGTPAHLAALWRRGPSPIHRRSFAPVRALAHPVQPELGIGRAGRVGTSASPRGGR